MQGLHQSNQVGIRFRAHVAKLMLSGAVSCLLAAPAGAQGYATPVNWSGVYVSLGIGVIDMNTDTRVNAARKDDVHLDIECQNTANFSTTSFSGTLVECTFDGPEHEFKQSGGASIQVDLSVLQQMLLNIDDLSDRGVMGVLSIGGDYRLPDSNWLLGGFAAVDFFDIEAEFSSQVRVETQSTIIIDDELIIGTATEPDAEQAIAGALIGAALANGIPDGNISIDGKIEQDYAFQVGGRIGHIWNEAFMTYFGAAWTRASIDGHVNVNYVDPICSEGLCEGSNSPTAIRLNLDEDVDGYKLLVGGEYALGYAAGGSWYLRGEASWSDFDGITKAFFGSKSQQLFSQDGSGPGTSACVTSGTIAECEPSIDITRLINESASLDLDKEDLAVHAALVYKLGGAPAPVHKPMK